ncbi:hypothetical protein H2199_002056 [Coniosporium tulheliwenetii]|uniref:Uncharacterized protein n=1 Tax=Coniosporium tulheliwenetii TaxID=3383036 RepID=A0ACC2ZHQ8_9PEZI|nr:hypothetical protein H2199_002056 [Cladosporium sp. JES 115]
MADSIKAKLEEMQLLGLYREQMLANASALFGGICDVCTIRMSSSDAQASFSAAIFRPSTEKGSVKVFLMRIKDEEERIREIRAYEKEDEEDEKRVVFKHAYKNGEDGEDDEDKENKKDEAEEDEDGDMENEKSEGDDEDGKDEDVITPLTSRLATMERLLEMTEAAIQEGRFVALTGEDWEDLEKEARKREPTPSNATALSGSECIVFTSRGTDAQGRRACFTGVATAANKKHSLKHFVLRTRDREDGTPLASRLEAVERLPEMTEEALEKDRD